MPQTYAALLAAGSPLLHGCESCDFSFGPIPTQFTVTLLDAAEKRLPEDAVPRDGTLEICAEVEEGSPPCQEIPFAVADRWTWRGLSGWEGYVTCRVPDLWFTAAVDGCAVREVHVPGGKGLEHAPIVAGLVLRCDDDGAAE